MKITVCELNNDASQFKKDWLALIAHCQEHQSDLVLLPEMPFYPWIAHTPKIDDSLKQKAIASHQEWLQRIPELGVNIVAYSKPVQQENKFYNTAYIWTPKDGHQKVHTKHFFPEEPGFYEATWFDHEPEHFELIEVAGIKIGFLLCTEVWFTQFARKYGFAGIDLLLCPRATGKSSVPQWLRCGQTLSIISGSYCLSSNRSGIGAENFEWGGTGWISQPMDGTLLGTTTKDTPFLTINIDLKKTALAKKEYPLYVKA